MKRLKPDRETAFFLLFIAFISAFNYYLTYHNIKFNWFLALTYVLDTLQGWAAWFALRSIVRLLDKKLPYHPNPIKRILVQVGISIVVCLFIIAALTEISSWIVMGRPALLNFYTFDIFIIIVWLLVLNGIYIGMHFYREYHNAELRGKEAIQRQADGFQVKHGKSDLRLPFEEIAAFYSDNGSTYLQTHLQKKFIIDGSLDKIEEQLPEADFFRLNRRYIVHRKSMTGFKRIEDGKLEVMVKESGTLPASITVSRLRSAQFKKWFEQ